MKSYKYVPNKKQIFFSILLAAIAIFIFLNKNALSNPQNIRHSLFAILLTAGIIYLPSIRIRSILQKCFFLLSPMAAYIIVQGYAKYPIRQVLASVFTPAGIGNLFLYAFILSLFYMCIGHMKYSSALFILICSVFGLANYFVMEFRITPILASDFASVGTAMDVAGAYTYTLRSEAIISIIYTLCFLFITLSFDGEKGINLKGRLCSILVFLCMLAIFHSQFRSGKYMLKNNIGLNRWSPEDDYTKNGALLSLLTSYTYYKAEKPADYSAAALEEITSRYESDKAGSQTVQPNIIAVMNEAFSDLSIVAPIETTEDYMPFFHSLTENVRKGNLYVSVRGTGTATTEFEFLTGNSMAFLPFRCVAYTNYPNMPLLSLTTTLQELGYGGNIAAHPGKRNAWNRDIVYPNMGFENFYDNSSWGSESSIVHGNISDSSDYDFIIRQYEDFRSHSQQPFYIFNVTIQNHSPYDSKDSMVDETIKITNEGVWKASAQQYINLIKISDNALKELVKYFSQKEEPTVIVFFGDHQPSIKPQPESRHASDDLENSVNLHTVPYLIWANYDIGTDSTVKNISVNYLSAYLLDTIGSPLTGYQKFLLEMSEKVPLLTEFAYRGDDNVLHPIDEISGYSDQINEYAILQYNNMFDSKHSMDSFFHISP